MMASFRQHLGDHIATIIVIGVMGGTITYVELVRPSLSQLANIIPTFTQDADKNQPKPDPAPSVTPPPAAKPAEPQAPVVAPAPPPPPVAPVVKKAVTNSFVHMRAGKGTQFPIVMDLEAGTEVELRDDSNSQWQGIIYQGKPGYLFKAYVTY
jgi:hypothetical protein